jgi:PAS domain S-box-containing protein
VGELEFPPEGKLGTESLTSSAREGPVGLREIAAALAGRIAEEAGEGCVIRRRRRGGELIALAAEHRLRPRRDALRAELHRPPLPPPGGWIGQAIELGCALRLPDLRPETLAEAGLPPEEWIGDVLVVPVRVGGLAIVAVRDRDQGIHSFPHRLALERIAADARGELVAALAAESPEYTKLAELDSEQPSPAAMPSEVEPILLDHAPAGVWVIDEEGNTTSVNATASEMVGVPIHELLGAPVPQLLRRPRMEPRWNIHAEEESELEIGRPDGSTLWLSTVSRPLFDPAGETTATVVTMLPVGDRKRREVELRMRLGSYEAFAELIAHSLGKTSLPAVMADAADLLLDELGAELVTVESLDRERDELRLLCAAARAGKEEAARLEGLPPAPLSSAPIAERALREAGPVEVRDLEHEFALRPRPELAALGARGLVCVPLSDDGALISAYLAEPQALAPSDIELIELIGRWIAGYDDLLTELAAVRDNGPRVRLNGSVPATPACGPARPPSRHPHGERRGWHRSREAD